MNDRALAVMALLLIAFTLIAYVLFGLLENLYAQLVSFDEVTNELFNALETERRSALHKEGEHGSQAGGLG